METILIATDFSAAARNATRYGFELSKKLKAKVILFNACQLPSSNSDSVGYVTPNEKEAMSYRQLVIEAETYDPLGTVALQTESRPGPITDSILTVAKENNVSFIVAGMKAGRKEIRKIFGSTVTYLRNQSSIPIIVVPEDVSFSVPKTIALASDNMETGLQIVEPLKKIAELFTSKLFVVRVIEKLKNEVMEKLTISRSLKGLLSGLQPTYEFIKEDNVTKAMNNFVKQHAVDMVALIPRQHDLLQKIFTRSITKEMIFQTRVPLLLLT